METKINGLSNYYGHLAVKNENEKCFIGVTCEISITEWKEISQELYVLLINLNKNK